MLNLEEFARSGRLFDNRYQLLRPLSTDGGTADVWLAIDTNTIDMPDITDDENPQLPNVGMETGLKVAIKVYRPKNALDIEGEQRFRDEYKIVFNCHHTHLLQPINFSIFQETPYLVMPFCSHGSSAALIGQGVSNDELWRYIEHVASGLAYLHELRPPIIHQDVKPANVLIDDNGNYTITDFGISTKFGGGHHGYDEEESSGTLAYMAPERFQMNYQPMAESDIWAVGATLYEIITGQVPFGESGGVNQTNDTLRLTYPPGLSADIKKVIEACLDRDPAKRPTAQQLAAYGKAKKVPSKAMKILKWSLLPLVLIALGVAIFFQLSKEKKAEVQVKPTKSAKVVYDEAMTLINSQEPDSVKAGIYRLTDIEDSTYVPALYELAFTYGCYSDTVSLYRKQLLGIKVGNNNVDERAMRNMAPYLPQDDQYNNKAMTLFRRIVESPDNDYIETKMKAAYRLGVYYLYYTRNVSMAKKYYHLCQEWAIQLDDKDMLQMVAVALSEAK